MGGGAQAGRKNMKSVGSSGWGWEVDFFFQTSPLPFTSSEYDRCDHLTHKEGAGLHLHVPKCTWDL